MPTGVTACVQRLLKYGSRAQLEALVKLAGRNGGFDDTEFNDPALVLEVRRRKQKVLETAYEKGGATEEMVLDKILALGRAYMWVGEGDESQACYERAKEGFMRLLGEDSAKAVGAAFRLVRGSTDKKIAEYRRLWEMAKVSLPDEVVTYDVANELGAALHEKGKYDETKVLWLTALEGRRRVLGDEHKKNL